MPNEASQQPLKHVIPPQQPVVQAQLPFQIPQLINKFQNIESCHNTFLKYILMPYERDLNFFI